MISSAAMIVVLALIVATAMIVVAVARATTHQLAPGPWIVIALLTTAVAYVVGVVVAIRDDETAWASVGSIVAAVLVALAGITAFVLRSRTPPSIVPALLAQVASAVAVAGIIASILT